MKNKFFTYFFALLFAILPIESLVGASGQAVTVSGTTLTTSNPCIDTSCSARFEADGNVANLYLKSYNGGAISIQGYDVANVIVDGYNNRIETTGEYGLKSDARELNVYGADSGKNLYIIVNSSTDRANGILATAGSVNLGNAFNLGMSIHSAASADTITDDRVTGITTPLNQTLTAKLATNIMISNYTGNYGIYTGKTIVKEGPGLNFLGEITYKITDGVGDAFYNNDYTGTEIPDDPVVDIAHAPYLTYVKSNYGTSGAFKFVTPIQEVSAVFDNELTSGEDLAAANTRIKNSLQIDDAHFTPVYLDSWSSKLVIADDFETGEYHEIDPSETEIKAGERYALKIVYQNWEWDMTTFSEVKGETVTYLNGETYDTFKRVSKEDGYILAPLELDGVMTDYEPAVVLNLETVTPRVIIDRFGTSNKTATTETTIIPKTPNTGRK